MKKQAEREMHLGTPKASYRALVCRETLIGVAARKSKKLTGGSYAIMLLGDNHYDIPTGTGVCEFTG
jgi:hypothetical protein